jgi:hypothetical protein
MPAPVIEELAVLYPAGRSYLLPGESAMVTATVTDPSGSTAEVTVTVLDSEGNTAHGTAVISLNDELDIAAALREMDIDAGWSIAPAAGHASRWFVSAPS